MVLKSVVFQSLKTALPSWVPQSALPPRTGLFATGVVALLVGMGGTRLVLQPKPVDNPVPTVQPLTLKTVTALGRLEPQGDVIQLSAPSSTDGSRVEILRVKVGDRVRKGEIVAILNSQARLKAALEQSERQVSVMRAKLAQVKSGAKQGELDAQRSEISRLEVEKSGEALTQSAVIARLEAEEAGDIRVQSATIDKLQAEVNNARVEADRYTQLFNEGGISASMRDAKKLTLQTTERQLQEAQASLDRSRNTRRQQIEEAKAALTKMQDSRSQQVDSAAANLDRIAEVRPVDIVMAEAELSQAEAAATKAEADLEQAYVRAPQDGTILKIHTRAGEKIATTGIVDLGQTQRMMAVLEVYETDVKRIKLGQTTTITSDAIDAQITGKVEEIGQTVLRQNVVNTDPTANTDARVIEVKILLDPDSSHKVDRFSQSQVTAKIAID